MKIQSRLGVTVAGISPGHVAVTVNDGDTVNFTASGTDNQTITAEVVIDPAVDNITVATVDGVYTKLIDEVTYTELAALISGSDLIQGRQYLITDYQTVHASDTYYPLGGTTTGVIEPIIVTASNVNKLEPIAYSTVHTSDILWYNPTNYGGTYTFGLLGSTKGWIVRRVDTINNIDTPFDFRSTTFRRYKVAVTNVWDIGTAYVKYDIVVKALGDGNAIYMATDSTTGDDPAIDDGTNWITLPFTNGSFSATKRSVAMYIMGANVPIDIASFTDYPMFAMLSNVKNFILKTELSSHSNYNSVFLANTNKDCYIDATEFNDNTFYGSCIGNTILIKNTLRDVASPYIDTGEIGLSKYGFSGNKISGTFFNNFITDNFAGNQIVGTTDCKNNKFTSVVTHNYIADDFSDNIIEGAIRFNFLQGNNINIKTTLEEKNLYPYALTDSAILKTIKKTVSNFVIEELNGSNILTYTTIV